MAAIKIQSLEDIVGAYLKSLGFKDEMLSSAVRFVVTNYLSGFNGGDVIGALDDIVLQNVNVNFGEKLLPDEQKTAWFKAAFLLNDGAQKWGIETLCGKKVSAEAVRVIRSSWLKIVPDYCLSQMKEQKIEPIKTVSLLGKVLSFWGKR